MDWRNFLLTAGAHLGLNPCDVSHAWSWCSWTTFTRLGEDAGYWTAPLPLQSELLAESIADGGTWGQPFRYADLAHVVVPRRYVWENVSGDAYDFGMHEQDIVGLSKILKEEGIEHCVSDVVLDIKIY